MSEIQTKDDYVSINGIGNKEDQIKDRAIENGRELIGIFESLRSEILSKNSVQEMAFTFGAYFDTLNDKLSDNLDYLQNDMSTQ